MSQQSHARHQHRTPSPLAYINFNYTRNNPQQLLKNIPQELHRIKRVHSVSQNTSPHHFSNVGVRERTPSQHRSRPEFVVKREQNKGQVSGLKYNLMVTSNVKAKCGVPKSFSIIPFNLNVEPEIPLLQQKSFLKIKQLGKGKFGTVWLVVHKKTNFVCALKMISKKVVKEQKVEHQVARQICIHNQLRHRNIIQFYGFFSDQNHFYIVTQFAAHGHLYGQIRKNHRLEEEEVKKYIKQTVQGVKFMHDLGFIHRDIKPQNLLLQFDTVKICDLGWAAECSDSFMRKSSCGTPLYYSPQIVSQDSHNYKLDIWSIGLLAYELLVGRIPFKIWSEFDLGVVLTQQVQIPDYVDASEHLKDFILKCLIKNQSERPSIQAVLSHSFFYSMVQQNIAPQFQSQIKRLL